jgi:tetratricopeptide (TPR) repeat protein
MGEIPGGPLFPVKLWFAVALLTSATVRLSVGQVTSAPPSASPPQKVSAPERKTLSQELPAQTRADILMARGEYAAAISAFQQSDLKSALVWNSIGMAYHHLYALEEARKAYQQALSINPRFAPAANNLAAVYYGQHDFRDAEHWYKRALKHTSESAVIYCNLGTAYFGEGNYKKGLKMYQKAFSIDDQVFVPDQSKMVEGGSSREQRVAINYYIAETFAFYLRKAMDEGFKDRKRLDEDKDFATLRTTPQFQELLNQENLN